MPRLLLIHSQWRRQHRGASVHIHCTNSTLQFNIDRFLILSVWICTDNRCASHWTAQISRCLHNTTTESLQKPCYAHMYKPTAPTTANLALLERCWGDSAFMSMVRRANTSGWEGGAHKMAVYRWCMLIQCQTAWWILFVSAEECWNPWWWHWTGSFIILKLRHIHPLLRKLQHNTP